ncbi:peptide-methionine (S)-S-oxide reductase [Christiangramia sabulilitoris]|uniref:peptide-methionine (S)-S-oxide reductase n=1 Tax=Christiangramia sabulilitoris TaxID=2583991 RepID=A0A550I699_9FLAO|nr:peptide-methionine (S)-S-oxide reductase [Christiangramia sabulilitoris]TRO66487.1 peptide-methionine (S)-S-oxide reductase [Christiangramia sabulilitoris]
MSKLIKIGFGGGCHWCTEAVFQSLIGVEKVGQGYISTREAPEEFYEGVLVRYDPDSISLKTLIKVHISSHKSTSNHSMRSKYLSAVYTFDQKQFREVEKILKIFTSQTEDRLITRPIRIKDFKASRPEIINYYKTDPERPFCKTYIEPKLKILRNEFEEHFKKGIG